MKDSKIALPPQDPLPFPLFSYDEGSLSSNQLAMFPKSSTACISALTFSIIILCSSFSCSRLSPCTTSAEQISFIRSTAVFRSASVSDKKDSTGSLESRIF